MDTDSLYTGILTASFHLVREKRFCNGKEPLVRSKHIAGSDILLQFLTQKIWNWNFSLAFSCLWSGNDILSVKTLIGFVTVMARGLCSSRRFQSMYAVQSEQAFAGHLLICFMATAIMQKLQQELLKRRSRKAKSLNAESIFSYLRNQKCKVYKDYAVPQEPRKEANAIYDIFKVQVPYKIPLTTIEV